MGIKSFPLLLLLLLCMGMAHGTLALARGRIIVETLHTQALAGNAIDDTLDRKITIYLPPGYDTDTTTRYPVVYLLHGATSDPKEWLDGTYQGMNLGDALDQRAAQAQYIVVMPMANNRFGGSFYLNSAAFGRWEDLIANELVRFIDTRFRTLPTRQSRALAGHSMGGFGALYLAGRHADVFAHVYALSPCCLGFVGDIGPEGERWRSQPHGWLKAMAIAFAPGPLRDVSDPPLPFVVGPDGRVREIPVVARAWRAYLPLDLLARDPAPYRRLCSIAIDAGTHDEIPSVTMGAEAFSRGLGDAGIPHAYTAFEGGHVDRVRDRFETVMLPFFARVLATQGKRGACGPK